MGQNMLGVLFLYGGYLPTPDYLSCIVAVLNRQAAPKHGNITNGEI